eukprot:5997750-Prymnesium_polylepis.1
MIGVQAPRSPPSTPPSQSPRRRPLRRRRQPECCTQLPAGPRSLRHSRWLNEMRRDCRRSSGSLLASTVLARVIFK